MLDQFRQKLNTIPQNLTLLNAGASQLPFLDRSFDVVLTVHMLHTISNWKIFLNEVDRVLKLRGVYLNAQWITPPARMEFEGYLKTVLSKYEGTKTSKRIGAEIEEINVEEYFCNKGYRSSYLMAKDWTVSNTVEELLSYFKSRAYSLC